MISSRLERAYDSSDLDALFPDGAPITTIPWSRAAPLTRRPDAERAAVASMVRIPPRADQFVDLDPRALRASQPSVTRSGVAYYLEDEYRRSGRTYADQLLAGNKFPIVHERAGDFVVLSGHHRAAAALLRGEHLRARVVRTVVELDAAAAVVVTPALFLSGTPPTLEHMRCSDTLAAEVWINLRESAWLPAAGDLAIRHLAYELGIEESWIRHQLHYARTGRIVPPTDPRGGAKDRHWHQTDGVRDRGDGALGPPRNQ